ncbi:MAG: hypothetical protein HZB29_06850 [Nitrospinae bacterium]|nr:hypothetical protein [Nitrospinota bacterium]
MPGTEIEPGLERLDPNEARLARALINGGMVSKENFIAFLGFRNKLDSEGRRYLGDILVERGYIRREDVEEFFMENNQLYLSFCEKLANDGYLSDENHAKIASHPDAKVNVVSLMEKLGIMTKESFTKLFSKRVNALRLGDWLVAKRRIDAALLSQALAEQKIYRLEDYLVYHKLITRDGLDGFKRAAGIV